MKKLLFVITAFAFSIGAFAQGVSFEHIAFKEALAKAKAENKLVFMDCYTVWCGPCNWLSREVFPLKEVGDFFNSHFINIKMDMEKGEGVELRKKYGVTSFPTLLWLDTEGNVKHKVAGAGSADMLLEDAKAAADPEKNWAAVYKRYQNGDRSLEFLQEFILSAFKAKYRKEAYEASEIYFSKRKKEDMINAKDAEIILLTVRSLNDDKFRFVYENREKFCKVFDPNQINQFFLSTMMNEITPILRAGDEEALEKKRQELFAFDASVAEKLFANIELLKSAYNPDKSKIFESVIDRSLASDFDNSQALYLAARTIVNAKIELKGEMLQKLLKMAKRSVELDETCVNADIYAYLLDKSGETKEAKKMAKKSVKLATDEQKKELWAAKYLDGKL